VADHHPRYVVREITGYSTNAERWPAPTTSVWVSDTWNCHREVAYLPSEDRHGPGGRALRLRVVTPRTSPPR
jgi:hypothetical protein